MSEQSDNAERLAAACLLSIVGGFLDIYTYLWRGGVFANAVTGNMVLFGLSLAGLRGISCAKYLLPISFYAAGVLAAECIHRRMPMPRQISWRQFSLLVEIIALLPVIFVPYGDFDFAVNALISFVCALQVQSFRRVNGLPFASTMCTGNLRSGTEALFRKLNGDETASWETVLHYFLVIGCFITGAALGAFLLRRFGHQVFFLAPLGLLAALLLITGRRQWVMLRRSWKKMIAPRGR